MEAEKKKDFDAVALMRALRERVSEDLEKMTPDEFSAHVMNNLPDKYREKFLTKTKR